MMGEKKKCSAMTTSRLLCCVLSPEFSCVFGPLGSSYIKNTPCLLKGHWSIECYHSFFLGYGYWFLCSGGTAIVSFFTFSIYHCWSWLLFLTTTQIVRGHTHNYGEHWPGYFIVSHGSGTGCIKNKKTTYFLTEQSNQEVLSKELKSVFCVKVLMWILRHVYFLRTHVFVSWVFWLFCSCFHLKNFNYMHVN